MTARLALKHGWTGGQYSLFRVALGAYLAVHFTNLVPWAPELFSNAGVLPDGAASPLLGLFPNVLALSDTPAAAMALTAAGAMAAVPFALGWHDRIAALVLWYALACLFGRNPPISNPSLPFVGWMLLAHAWLPRAPFGALAARGRIDPAGDWYLDPRLFAIAWVVMSVGYSYSGYTKLVSPSWLDGSAFAALLDNPISRPGGVAALLRAAPDGLLAALTWATLAIELLFAPLALVRRLRPWLWGAMLAMHVGLVTIVDFADLSLGMILLHAFTFDPAWIGAKAASDTERVFYDGACGLCHGTVRFILAEDRSGVTFRFAALQSETFEALVEADRRAQLPDSLVVRTADGALLLRSEAVLHIAERLGGVWRALAIAGRALPRPIRDKAYDGIAAIRHRLFATPDEACPLLPPPLRARFDP